MGESGLFEFYTSVSSCLGSQLPNPELNDLMHLQVSDWSRLGLKLKLDPYELDIIKKDHPNSTKSQTCEMFKIWLRTQPDASYEQLIEALHKVGDKTVANSLYKKDGKYHIFLNLVLNYNKWRWAI